MFGAELPGRPESPGTTLGSFVLFEEEYDPSPVAPAAPLTLGTERVKALFAVLYNPSAPLMAEKTPLAPRPEDEPPPKPPEISEPPKFARALTTIPARFSPSQVVPGHQCRPACKFCTTRSRAANARAAADGCGVDMNRGCGDGHGSRACVLHIHTRRYGHSHAAMFAASGPSTAEDRTKEAALRC